jgi:hypothetical protein
MTVTALAPSSARADRPGPSPAPVRPRPRRLFGCRSPTANQGLVALVLAWLPLAVCLAFLLLWTQTSVAPEEEAEDLRSQVSRVQ